MMRVLCCPAEEVRITGHAARSVVGASHAADGTGNQDAHFVERADGYLFAGVFDGHGTEGDKAAGLACTTVRTALLAAVAGGSGGMHAWLQGALKEAGRVVRDAPCAASSGTTATVVGVHNDECVLGHVGDSCAALVARDWRHLRPRYVTKPHRPGVSPSEDSRVIKYGGILYEGYVVDKVSMRKGISVTRTLGDNDMTVNGCIAEPEMAVVQLQHKDEAIVIASDGLWDAYRVNTRTVAQAVDDAKGNAQTCVDALVRSAGLRPVDDCTVVVVTLR